MPSKYSQNPSPTGGKVTYPTVPNSKGPERGASPGQDKGSPFKGKVGQSVGTGVLGKQRKGYGEQGGREKVSPLGGKVT